MSEYEKPYKILFNAITNALKEPYFESAKGILILAQIEAEEAFMDYIEIKKGEQKLFIVKGDKPQE